MINYSNCILKGIKTQKIGRYKDCDISICIDCKKRCEEIKKGDKVRFNYEVKKGRKFKKYYKTGIIEVCDKKTNYFEIVSENCLYYLKKENIMYKFDTCPWCRSHRLRDWHKNTKKFPKIKQKKTKCR